MKIPKYQKESDQVPTSPQKFMIQLDLAEKYPLLEFRVLTITVWKKILLSMFIPRATDTGYRPHAQFEFKH